MRNHNNSSDCQMADGTNSNNWWWLAVNGASCAASGVPMPSTVEVTPTPEQLIGFRTRAELIATQRLLLNAPIDEVEQFMKTTIPKMISCGEVAYIRPNTPEPPTHGPTMWILNGRGDDDCWIERE